VDSFEPAIRRLLAATPDMPATVVAERIGWTRGITVLRERVAELRPSFKVPEAFGRTEYKPGELCQWDLWFPTTPSRRYARRPCCRCWWGCRATHAGSRAHDRSKESADVLGGISVSSSSSARCRRSVSMTVSRPSR